MKKSLYFSEELNMLRDQIRRFIETDIVPNGDTWEEVGKVPRDVFAKMGALGFLGMRYPEKYGGADLDVMASVVLAEELGRCTFGGFSADVLVHTDMASPHLANVGTPEQLERWMPSITSGEKICAIAVTEAGSGSDVAGMRTRAVRDGNGWVINGTKMFITNGVHADLIFVAAKTDLEAKGSRGVTIFAVEKDALGFSVGKKLNKTGWLCSDTAELIFEDVRVTGDNILGEVNKGFYAIMKNFQNERTVMGAMAMGEAQKGIELTLEHVKNRPAFDGVLWDKQAIRHKLAERSAQVEAGRQLTYHAAWMDAHGMDCVKEVSMVKAYCGDLVNKVMYDCVQFHGGMGYMRETPVERMSRDARIQSIGGGATEVMLEEIAKRL
ncbi:MAG: acyl-CoA dehydrogenase family protein [Planktomarina sp.]|jgi:acyl-CoA dehydrogenase|nr:acyl-CoA dehydrogenase family protein [Planktomarina sp.]MDT2057012.1 acyl-CoA dehydrogenase family protein [Planktomarina sp.]MDT2073105.1 acyl-CoA dehydrogenase family protein [Planktomarina sp.]MDT2077900.1 acyl-CoA dehydrogenase family protein [Planktomarina sp.]|tara:strand:- start:1509 stop:2654 length:1146 start_codon:yes stop_codon:yes gene_type:complete